MTNKVKVVLFGLWLVLMVVVAYFADARVRNFFHIDPIQATQTVTAMTSSNTSSRLQSVVSSGKVHVAVQAPSKPFYYVEGGMAKGFNVEFLQLLFSQSEFGTSQISIDTSNAVDTYEDVPKALLKNKQVDIAIDGLTFKDGDLQGVSYSIPYVKDFGYSLITSKDSKIKTISDLVGKRVGILKGDTDVKDFAQSTLDGVTLVELTDAAVDGQRSWIYSAINSGKVAAVIYDYPFGVAEIEGTNLQFAISKMRGSDIQYKIGIRTEDKDLMMGVNSAISKVTGSVAYTNLLKKYFVSQQVTAKSASSNESVYVVKQGDTLSMIATSLLGNRMRYVEIETRNNLPNPNLISVGQKLVIPR